MRARWSHWSAAALTLLLAGSPALADSKGGTPLFGIDASWSEILVGSRLAGCFGVSAEISSDVGVSLTPGVSWDFQVKAGTVTNHTAGRLGVDATVEFGGREGWVDPAFVTRPADRNGNGRLDDGESAGSRQVSLSETHSNVCRELLDEIATTGSRFDIAGYHIAYPHSTLDPALVPDELKRADGSIHPGRALEEVRKEGDGWIILLEFPADLQPSADQLAELGALEPDRVPERLRQLGAKVVIRRP